MDHDRLLLETLVDRMEEYAERLPAWRDWHEDEWTIVAKAKRLEDVLTNPTRQLEKPTVMPNEKQQCVHVPECPLQ